MNLKFDLGVQLIAVLLLSGFTRAVPPVRRDSQALWNQTPASSVHAKTDTSVILVNSKSIEPTTLLPATSRATDRNPQTKTTQSAATSSQPIPYCVMPPPGAVDPFQAVATGPAPSQITPRGNHPIPRLNIKPQNRPLHTNKFYANFYLGDQNFGTFTHPYSLTWSKGGGPASSWGMAVTHVNYNQKVYGPPQSQLPGQPAHYMINPIGIQDVILSAAELGSQTVLSTSELDTFSANAILTPSNSSTTASVTFPMVQGMGFVTGVYQNLTPWIQAGHALLSMNIESVTTNGIFKYRTTYNDGSTWLIYAIPYNQQDPKLRVSSGGYITGPSGYSGIIQVAKLSNGAGNEALYDASAGVYPTSAVMTGSVTSTVGSYTITWAKAGVKSRPLLMWALPHHVQTLSGSGIEIYRSITMTTTTKGNATAVVGDAWTLTEVNLPISMGFAPWDPVSKLPTTGYSANALAKISVAAIAELSQDIGAQTNLNSMYYSGKGLAKFASIVYVAKDILKNNTLAAQGLAKLEQAFSLFTTNRQQLPLVYDTSWGGAVSVAGYSNGNILADFGNTAYNDHHFHYGYFIYAAAVIGYMDPNWLAANKDWVNSLVRDVSNPSKADNVYPVFRNFDWYHGHSWAHGLFSAGDSKDEESSSEDTNFAYALKMWGHVIGDTSMEARGNLMLSVLARSLRSYFLYEDSNNIMPPPLIQNKVSGILFENKIDHTTYFGANLEFVQGIHMLPILPHSALTRTRTFVMEEWQRFFADNAVDPASKVQGGWRGILYANLALYDANASYAFFSQPNFNPAYLDGGASLTWYLAYAAGRAGA